MIIYRDIIDDQKRQELVHSVEYQNARRGQYFFWRGWWHTPPKNKIEEVLELLWKDKIDVDLYADGGVEYWMNKTVGPTRNQWHQDVVEVETSGSKLYVPGDRSIVYYPYVFDLSGGYLELADYNTVGDKSSFRTWLRMLDQSNIERIKPETNMAVSYESARAHRVAPNYDGVREALASTLWRNTPETFKHASQENSNVD